MPASQSDIFVERGNKMISPEKTMSNEDGKVPSLDKCNPSELANYLLVHRFNVSLDD